MMSDVKSKTSKGLKGLWDRGLKAVGAWSMLESPIAAGMLAESGFDFICFDLQHGLAGPESLPTLIQVTRGTRAVPLVRVAWNDPVAIMRALDAGAEGVIVPMVNNAADARAAVAACRYPPLGYRSWGQMQAEALASPEAPEDANERVVCAVMIETAEAFGNLGEILGVQGVDAVYIGPNDLALSLGLGRATYATSPEMRSHIETVLRACQKAHVIAGIHCSSSEMTLEWAREGFQLLTAAADLFLLKAACRNAVDTTRSANTT